MMMIVLFVPHINVISLSCLNTRFIEGKGSHVSLIDLLLSECSVANIADIYSVRDVQQYLNFIKKLVKFVPVLGASLTSQTYRYMLFVTNM